MTSSKNEQTKKNRRFQTELDSKCVRGTSSKMLTQN